MDVNFVPVGNICRGCLSAGRRMINASVFEAVYRELTGIFMSPADVSQWMCYECSALLQKFIRFRDKVTRSHSALFQFALENIQFTQSDNASPHLKRTNVLYCDIVGNQPEEPQEPIDTFIEEPDLPVITKIEGNVNEVSKQMKQESRKNIKREAIVPEYEDDITMEEWPGECYDSDSTSTTFSDKEDDQTDQGEESLVDSYFTSVATHSTLEEPMQFEETISYYTPQIPGLITQTPVYTYEYNQIDPVNFTPYNVEVPQKILNYTLEAGDRPYKCKVCEKMFRNVSNFNQHHRIHLETKPFTCNVCMKGFSDRSNLNRHALIHTGAKPYECDICRKTFNNRSALIKHVGIHTGDKPYQCDICSKYFRLKYKLAEHKLTHIDKKRYKCTICMKAFKEEARLDKHLRIHSDSRPHKCDVCLKCFRSKNHLKGHVRIHNGDRPYKCDVCTKCFNDKRNYTRHYRIHTGERPYKCDYCMKGFINRSALIRHISIHTGEKPFKCDICMGRFRLKDRLNEHKRMLHKIGLISKK